MKNEKLYVIYLRNMGTPLPFPQIFTMENNFCDFPSKRGILLKEKKIGSDTFPFLIHFHCDQI